MRQELNQLALEKTTFLDVTPVIGLVNGSVPRSNGLPKAVHALWYARLYVVTGRQWVPSNSKVTR